VLLISLFVKIKGCGHSSGFFFGQVFFGGDNIRLWTILFGVYAGENPAGDLHDNLKDTKDDEYADVN
jgi:hypothetical protein